MISSCTLVSIFEEHEGRQISELITVLSGVKIENSDLLSKKICKECELKALELYAFRQLCIDSDETVRYNLMLADDDDSESNEIIADETLKAEGPIESLDQIEEYFVEDDGESEYQQHDEQHLEYDELFVNDSGEEINDGHHQVIGKFEAIEEDETFDEKPESKHSVMIERFDSKRSNAANSVNLPTDELTKKMREAHFAKEHQKKHKCPHCDKFFMFPSKVARHVNAVHKNLEEPKKSIRKNHHCNICGKAFVSMFKVRRHMVVHDTELKMGLQKNWSRNYFLCEACNKKFHTKSTFDRHMLICELLQKSTIERPDDHEYFCVICAHIFSTHDEMIDHIKTHLPNETSTCVMCPDVTYQLSDMIRHGKYHEENVTYRCCVCMKCYPNGEEIVTHLLRHKEYKPFHCDFCDRAFFDKYKLRQHRNTHDPNIPKNFICSVCDRAFAAQDYLNCHIRRKHSDVKPYKCAFCPKSFAFLHDLNLHSSIHTGKSMKLQIYHKFLRKFIHR